MTAIKKNIIIYAFLMMFIFTGCSLNTEDIQWESKDELVFGTTVSTKSLDPANAYSGWYTVRYGIGETLFKLDDNMKPVPWLADSYELINDVTWAITIKDNIYFHNGKDMTAESVKESLERAIELNARAADTLKIKEINVEGNKLIITTSDINATLISDLCDPFSAIIDVNSGTDFDTNPIGTGPFMVEKFNPSKASTFIRNSNYWDGEVKLKRIKVMPISDADTLAMAIQSGEIDVAQGISYATVNLLSDDSNYKISTIDTSRAIVMYFNENNANLESSRVRKAINMLIDKDTYTSVLLNGSATPSTGPFPTATSYGTEMVSATEYNIEEALKVLEEEGYNDSDGDGILDKEGHKLSFTLITYTSRAELPTLAQAIQSDLKEAGIEVNVKISDSIEDILSSGDYDMALYSNVTAATGDPYSYLSYSMKTNGSLNYGCYSNENVDELINKLQGEFDIEKRAEFAIEIQQEVLNEDGYNFICHLRMNFVMKNNVVGFDIHPTDYYQFNANTDIE